MKYYTYLLLLTLFSSCDQSSLLSAQALTFEYSEGGVWVKENDERIFFYQQKTKSQNGEYARSNYVHPLYGLDGTVLTEDFPDDHPHHRGVFWTWHQVFIGDKRIGDAWLCEDFSWDVYEVQQEDSTLYTKTYWKSSNWTDGQGEEQPFLSEEASIKIHPATESYRVLDFEISLLALVPDLKIGGSEDAKGYGGFSVRMKLPKDIQFTSTSGKVTAQTEAVEAGPWMDISGSLATNGEKAGIVVMAHPNNPLPNNQWILRTKNSMQNPVYPGREPVLISDKEPTVLRYRLVVYQDKISEREINGLYEKMR
ncbi:DUF6807 family protein [Tunicatimonas pelagia]|uniref:DUF6807 family protein n=1 Tax=Tunicatimonas pelagia TaxID=931531 RepID=UPI002665CFFF|nr:DUF6807 family protein [Tunicatimonas pelagia]WKN45499.1 PmoA family protein [Tunicatimonas pelagia]